jgi:NAD(P)-dependent dehydrogenase (short-subunit alcohol dehydrogenase family)
MTTATVTAATTAGTLLAGKTAIVTGAASGLGFGIAQRLVAEGAAVILTDLDAAGGAAAAALLGPQARFVSHDVASASAWDAVAEVAMAAFGGIDIVVNNAGITLMGSVDDISLEAFDKTIEVNLRGTFLGCRTAIRLMQPRGAGVIINIASVSAFKPQAELVAYNASKAGVSLMTKSIALQCARNGSGIRVNSVNPGVIQTAMLDKVIAQVEDGEALMNSYRAMHPIGRIGQPQDIAAMVVYLASDAAGFITGSEFTVDGGLGIN